MKFLSQYLSLEQYQLILEPSAGNGSFYKVLPASRREGLDLLPEHPEIRQQDFFTYQPSAEPKRKILTIGNPPFGRNCSLAIRFFNHAATFSQTIAFIIPRTFRRISIQNRLALNFHLTADLTLPTSPCCFEPPMMAKCCFQIWEKRTELRQRTILPTTHSDWQFLPYGPKDPTGQPTVPTRADLAIRAYGGRVGVVVTERLHTLRPKSWHWIQTNGSVDTDILRGRFESLDYSLSTNTARQNSMGRGELVWLYSRSFS